MTNKQNNRAVQIVVIIVLLLLAFGDKIKLWFLENCSCSNPGNEGDQDLNNGGSINPPEPNFRMDAKSTNVDVELYERMEDQNVAMESDNDLIKTFFPKTGTLNLTQTNYDKISL